MTHIAQIRHWDGWMLDEYAVIRDGREEAKVLNERDGIVLEGKESPEALAFIAELQVRNRAAVAPPGYRETIRIGPTIHAAASTSFLDALARRGVA